MQRSNPSYARPFLLLSALALILVACTPSKTPAPTTETAAAPITCAAAANFTGPGPAPVPTIIDSSCAAIPYSPGELNNSGQQKADVFGWLSFVSLNWPANPSTCAPNPRASILTDATNPTWLTYLSDDAVYNAGPPAPWCGGSTGSNGVKARLMASESSYSPAVKKILAAHPEVHLVLLHNAKGHELVSTLHLLRATVSDPMKSILQSTNLPLVDQNGRFVRYSISLNKDEYDYIVAKKLNTVPGQRAISNIDFPMGSSPSTVGAIEIKAAWKVLGPGDNPSRFFTQQAIVYNNAEGAPSPGPNPVTVGLVGLHIAHKAKGQSTWTWSTFEQVDNDTKSFFNPNCTPVGSPSCKANTPTATSKSNELSPSGKPLNAPVQVVPYLKPTNPGLNSSFQSLLAGTPFQYYQLIGTQWSTGAIGTAPQFLGASVQETFVPFSSSGPYSCIGCHSFATAQPVTKKSDMSFIVSAPLVN
ncbi:hypothetical protein [Granulicella sp. dw_53]|uniref:hypothetical protein n=1 Tax=Granulicella sp. dw_53 TaxID=2719792 RepID=UPI001BD6DA33|nr:hypothetical protein [Granulicella sp. dw_53]